MTGVDDASEIVEENPGSSPHAGILFSYRWDHTFPAASPRHPRSVRPLPSPGSAPGPPQPFSCTPSPCSTSGLSDSRSLDYTSCRTISQVLYRKSQPLGPFLRVVLSSASEGWMRLSITPSQFLPTFMRTRYPIKRSLHAYSAHSRILPPTRGPMVGQIVTMNVNQIT